MPPKALPTVTELVGRTTRENGKRGRSWLDSLTSNELAYIKEVIFEVSQNPDCSIEEVAKTLIKEFDIKRSPETVASTIRKRARQYAQA